MFLLSYMHPRFERLFKGQGHSHILYMGAHYLKGLGNVIKVLISRNNIRVAIVTFAISKSTTTVFIIFLYCSHCFSKVNWLTALHGL